MSLMPFYFEDPFDYYPFNYRPRSSRILDQHFGVGLDPDIVFQPLNLNNRLLTRTSAGYVRNWRSKAFNQDCGSSVSFDQDQFEAILDVKQFRPEEITVKVTGDNVVTIEGKHQEKEDEHGYVSRHFLRKYVLPKNCDMGKITSKLSSDGVLSIAAPIFEKMEVENKNIPIIKTGEPANIVQQQKKQELSAGEQNSIRFL